MELKLRKAESRDTPTLRIIKQQALENSLSNHAESTEYADQVTRDHHLKEKIQNPQHEVLVAETPVTSVGFLIYDRDQNQITDIHVAPNHQRKGAGTELLNHLEKTLDTGTIQVDTPEPAAEFFRKQGFMEQNHQETEVVDHVLLEKST